MYQEKNEDYNTYMSSRAGDSLANILLWNKTSI